MSMYFKFSVNIKSWLQRLQIYTFSSCKFEPYKFSPVICNVFRAHGEKQFTCNRPVSNHGKATQPILPFHDRENQQASKSQLLAVAELCWRAVH